MVENRNACHIRSDAANYSLSFKGQNAYIKIQLYNTEIFMRLVSNFDNIPIRKLFGSQLYAEIILRDFDSPTPEFLGNGTNMLLSK